MNGPMRLAINGKFLAAAPTGVHRVAAELAHGLAAIAREQPDRIDVQLWVPHDAEQAAAAFDMDVRVIRPFVHIPWEQLRLPFADPDRLLLSLCNIGPVARTNAVTMFHDAQVHLTPQSYSRAFRYWYKGVQPLLGNIHRGVLTVSNYSREEIIKAGLCPADCISVVHNGVDHILRYVPDTSILSRFGLMPGRFAVALASTQAHKNIGLALKAFSSAELADLVLVLVGEGNADLFAAAGLKVPHNVVFAGRINDGALRALYEAAQCIVFPSRTEGFGLPPLEAMLVGCPAIVAPCGALPEICGDAALYGDPDDPAEWVRAICVLGDDQRYRETLVMRGRERAREFTWRKATETLIEAVGAVAPVGQWDDGPLWWPRGI